MTHPAYHAQSMPALNAARADARDLLQQATDLLAMCSAALHNHHRDTNKLTSEFQRAETHVNAAWRAVGYARDSIDH